MKLYWYPVTLIATLILLAGCRKEVSVELPQTHVDKANEFKKAVDQRKFRLTAFYSDVPIDYVEDDAEVKRETNLWGYVSGYLKDDIMLFRNDTDVDVDQNLIKMPGEATQILQRKYIIRADADGAYMKFLDYQYNPLEYHLHEITNDYFILYLPWKPGINLYSRFNLLP